MDIISNYKHLAKVATPSDNVVNTECVYTFHNPYSDNGILVNMNTFMGTIQEKALDEGTGIFLRIVKTRTLKEVEEKEVTKLAIGVEGGFASDDRYDVQSAYSIVILESKAFENILAEEPYNEETKSQFPMIISESAESIINHSGWSIQSDVKAWELDEEKIISKYAENLPFLDNGVKISPNPTDWKCEKSGDVENLWLNLSDGYIGGGRKNWDGSGGSNGALDHYLETGERYPLVVKLGTITGDLETADCFSYSKDEDCPVKVPNLEELLEKRGINMSNLKKTVKSTSELEVELNASYAFDAITESTKKLIPIHGPGYQGLQNLGNSCYINSIIQVLCSIPELASRYGGNALIHPVFHEVAPSTALGDLLAQTSKVAIALNSGIYSNPNPENETDPRYRIAPRMFKQVIGQNHVDFRTNQQQDAAQFLLHFIESLDRAELAAISSNTIMNKMGEEDAPVSSKLFSFQTTNRLVCTADNLVKYKQNPAETILSLRIPKEEATKSQPTTDPVNSPDLKRQKSEKEILSLPFESCLKAYASSTNIQDYQWPHLNAKHTAISSMKFTNFPRYLIVQMQRYELGPDWTPVKLEINLTMPEGNIIDLKDLRNSPLGDEMLVPEETETSAPAPTVDENALGQLMDMGFSMFGCKRALLATRNDIEAAMNWIFQHNSDSDFNDPLPESSDKPAANVNESDVASLVENLGCFTADQVRAALGEVNGSVERAADWLFSHMDDLDGAIASLQSNQQTTTTTPNANKLDDGPSKYELFGLVSHIGSNTNSGHYVCHLLKNDQWIIMNDEKVAISESPPFEHAYMYFFRQVRDEVDASF